MASRKGAAGASVRVSPPGGNAFSTRGIPPLAVVPSARPGGATTPRSARVSRRQAKQRRAVSLFHQSIQQDSLSWTAFWFEGSRRRRLTPTGGREREEADADGGRRERRRLTPTGGRERRMLTPASRSSAISTRFTPPFFPSSLVPVPAAEAAPHAFAAHFCHHSQKRDVSQRTRPSRSERDSGSLHGAAPPAVQPHASHRQSGPTAFGATLASAAVPPRSTRTTTCMKCSW